MKTHCRPKQLQFDELGRRKVVADFSGGQISSDGGCLLLREIDQRFSITKRLASCFADHRGPGSVEHSVRELIAQRIYGLALGYEDLNDHRDLSRDPLLATAVGKSDLNGHQRRNSKDRGIPLASPSTLGRIERTKICATKSERYEKIVCNFDKLSEVFTDVFIESFGRKKPKQITLDIDPSDIQLHGAQEDSHYNGYYEHDCYLPIYLFSGEYPLAVKLRPSNIDGAKGVIDCLDPVNRRLREKWPRVKILIRADSGFCREGLMNYCESRPGLNYLLGMGRNCRLVPRLADLVALAEKEYQKASQPVRLYKSFGYRTLKSWSRARRIIGKAQFNRHGSDVRFVVTSLSSREVAAQAVYETLYCARGEMENRIKEQQLDLFGDRASCHSFRGNHIRLWWSMASHLLIVKFRECGLGDTEFSKAQAATIRHRLLKIGALVETSVRRVHVRLSSAFPLQDLFFEIHHRLVRATPLVEFQ